MLNSSELFRPVHVHDPDRMEVGPKHLYWIPLNAPTLLAQQRTEYNPEQMQQLKDAIIIEDVDDRTKISVDQNTLDDIELIHPPTINIFSSRTKSREYVRNLRECFELDIPLDSIKPYEIGGSNVYAAVIAGHRRTIAIREIVKERDIDSDKVDVLYSVHEDLDFYSAIDLQYRENKQSPLTTWQDARAISSRYRAGLSRGEFSTYADCSRAMGVSAERVSNAWKFCQLPKEFQEDVKNSRINRFDFGKAVYLYDIAHAVAVSMHSNWIENSVGMTDDRLAFVKSELLSTTLGDLLQYFDDTDLQYLDYQLKLHRVALARTNIANAREYTRTNTADILGSAGITDLMTVDELEIISFAKFLVKSKETARNTYHSLATLVLQIGDDIQKMARFNEADNFRKLAIMHSPSARTVLRQLLDTFDGIDGNIPDNDFSEEYRSSMSWLVKKLNELEKSQTLPDIVTVSAQKTTPATPQLGML